MSKLTHFNEAGEAEMVDVGHKPISNRTALATGKIEMQPETFRCVTQSAWIRSVSILR